jgi:hypothetical protein
MMKLILNIAMTLLAPAVGLAGEPSNPPAGTVRFVLVQGEPEDAPPTPAEAAALARAAAMVNIVRGSECFRAFLADRRLIETGGRSPAEVAEDLRAVSGTIPVAFYRRCGRLAADCPTPTQAVAYRQPSQVKIFVNRAFFDVTAEGFDAYQLAGTLAHEGLGHLLGGYTHTFNWTPGRDFSVPYSIAGASPSNDDAFRHCRAMLGH